MKQKIKIKVKESIFKSSAKTIALSAPRAFEQDDKENFRACIRALAKK